MAFIRGAYGSGSRIIVEAFPYGVESEKGAWTGVIEAVTIREAFAKLHKKFADVADRKIKIYKNERAMLIAMGYSAEYIDAN